MPAMIAIIPHVPICHATESRATGRNGASPPAAFLATVRGADNPPRALPQDGKQLRPQWNGCTFRPTVRSESEARRRVPLLLCYGGTEIVDENKVAQYFKPLEGQSWNPPSLRARLERSWPARRPQTRAEVQPQIPPDHAAERRTANSPSSRQWMRKGLRRR